MGLTHRVKTSEVYARDWSSILMLGLNLGGLHRFRGKKCCCRDVTGNVPTDVQHDSAFKPMAMGYARECAVPSAPSWEGLSLLESMLLAEAASILAAPRYACHVQFSTSGISLP